MPAMCNRLQMSKFCCASQLRCQFRTCDAKIAPVKFRSQMRFQNAAAITKHSCDIKTQLRFEIAAAFFKSQLRFDIAAVIAAQLRFQNVTSCRNRRQWQYVVIGMEKRHMKVNEGIHQWQFEHSASCFFAKKNVFKIFGWVWPLNRGPPNKKHGSFFLEKSHSSYGVSHWSIHFFQHIDPMSNFHNPPPSLFFGLFFLLIVINHVNIFSNFPAFDGIKRTTFCLSHEITFHIVYLI